MSRPLRLLFPATCAVISLLCSGCGTVYDRMYSNKKTYFKPPKEKEVSADAIMKDVDKSSTPQNNAALPDAGVPGLPPAGAGDIPGLPPAGDAGMAPMTPAVPPPPGQ